MNRAKTVKHSAVSSHITQFCFTVDFLSAPGMSGSAIIADATGHIVGYLGGNYDSSAKTINFVVTHTQLAYFHGDLHHGLIAPREILILRARENTLDYFSPRERCCRCGAVC